MPLLRLDGRQAVRCRGAAAECCALLFRELRPAARGLVTKGCCAAQHPQHEGIIVIGHSRAAGCARSFRSAGVACDWLVERCGLRAQRLRTVRTATADCAVSAVG